MEIHTRDSNTLVISGNIKSIRHSQLIRESVENILKKGSRSLHLIIEDSFSMTSTVIGFLMKVANEEGIKISMTVTDERLWQLLSDFQLLDMFHVQRGSGTSTARADASKPDPREKSAAEEFRKSTNQQWDM
ncbi:hypothetical protein [Desulfurispira natronophila]|uniref:Anti-anti-sigma regulatory factor n=1 Tax=Desulfurispira natronophila TaxID=682562 RepID=A0A7W8DGK5_9BACT|nr:hypothetical protein [Desulfurispira natronophila]MBB5021464.1 anti-anti-sigma regulatory factor [Desulfurispira natronophila]